MNDSTADRLHRKALTLIDSYAADDPMVREEGNVLRPLPIVGGEGESVGWFIPIEVGDKLVSFFQFDAEETLMRYSTFQRRSGTLEGCPDSAAWLDPDRIMARARTKAGPAGELRPPVLSFDRSLSRIAWLVEAVGKKGETTRVFVAGDFAYVDQPD